MKGGIAFLLAGAATALTESPVTEVIEKLKTIESEVQDELKSFKRIYEETVCFCKNNDKAKNEEIVAAEARIDGLNANIEKGSALSAKLAAEIANAQRELDANIKALQEATALREKELASFNEEEKAMLVYIKQLEDALVALGGHEGGVSLLKLKAVVAAATGFGHIVHQDDLDNLSSLVQEEQDHFQAAGPPGTANSHNSRSNVIIGILKNMKDEFRSKLEESQANETQNAKNFASLKATKTKEIELGQQTVDKKTQEKADTDVQVATDQEALEDTRNNLSAANKYLMDMKKMCQDTDQQFELSQKAKEEELKAVNTAIQILDSDKAQETFSKNYNGVAFLQIEAHKRPHMSLAAMRTRLDAFTKVKKAIDDLVAEMEQQNRDEVAKADSCTERFHQNKMNTEDNTRLKLDLEAKRQKYDDDIIREEGEINTNKDVMHELKTELDKASNTRNEANKAFRIAMANNQDTIAILRKALTVLSNFFRKGQKSAEDHFAAEEPQMVNGLEVGFVQSKAEQPAGPQFPPALPPTPKHSGAEGVIALIKDIINDCKTDAAKMKQDEKDEQADFEMFTVQTQKSTKAEERSHVNNKAEKAEAEKRFQRTDKHLQETNEELENLEMEKDELKRECDYLLEHGAERKANREAEIQALQTAKAQLSGLDVASIMGNADAMAEYGLTPVQQSAAFELVQKKPLLSK